MHRILCLLWLTFSAVALMASDSVVVNCDAGQSLNKAISLLNKDRPLFWSRGCAPNTWTSPDSRT